MRIFQHYIPWNLFFFVIAEAAIIFGSVYAGQVIASHDFSSLWERFEIIYPKALTVVFISIITFYVGNLYDLSFGTRKRELIATILSSFIVIYSVVASVSFLIPYIQLSRGSYILSFSILIPSIIVFRIFYYWAINVGKLQRRVLILGTTEISRRISEELRSGNNPGFEVLGFVGDKFQTSVEESLDCKFLGEIKDLEGITQESCPDLMVIALSERRGAFPSKEILDCKLRGIKIEDWPTFYEKLTGKIFIQNLRPSWLIFADGFTRTNLARTIKRLVDILLSILGLCISLPLIVLIALLTKLDSVGPIFFRQERVGENGRVFTLVKFRTMVADAEKETGPVWAQTVDPRVTRLGRLLRRTGMDEIPQIFNVLKGDMSFVGPRPERPLFVTELQEKIPYYAQRLTVKPGITGWAQVRYGYGATIEDAIEKLQYDLYYIKNMSIFLDLLTILSTLHKVLFAKVAVQTSSEPTAAPSAMQPAVEPQSLVGVANWSDMAAETSRDEHVLAELSNLESKS